MIYDYSGNEVSGGSTSELLYNLAKWKNKIVVVEGNSLTASTNWGSALATFLGMTVYNQAQSGGSIIRNDTTLGSTIADITANVKNNYPSACDLIIMQGDTNTGMDGDFSDQMDGDDPKTTWAAKMNYMIRCLRAKYHNVVIVLMPDSVRYDFDGGDPTYNLNNGWETNNVVKYEFMRDFAAYNRLAFFDFDHATPWSPYYADNHYNWAGDPENLHTFSAHGMDWVHPSDGSYARAKGKALAMFVAGLLFDPTAPNTASEGWDEIYTVTISLGAGVTARQQKTSWWANMIYTNVISGAETVSVTMGGNDITSSVYNSSNGNIRIEAVTGDIVIAAE